MYANYARHHIDFQENLHSWHKFYTTAGRDGRDKSQLCHCPPVKVHHDTHKSHLLVNCGGEELPWRRIWLPPLGNLPQKNRGGRDRPHHHHHQGHHHKHQCDHHRHHNRRRHHYCHHTVFVAVIVIAIIIITISNKIIWLPPIKKLPQKRRRTLLCRRRLFIIFAANIFNIFCHICYKHRPCLT